MQKIQSLGTKALVGIAGTYLVAINVGSAGLFWYDKQQALRGAWRVPEKTLQFSGLLGGWIGGFWAMDKFRHKTRKQAFLGPYYACVAGNVALSGGLAYLVMGGEGSKQALNTFLRSESGKMIKREIMRRLKRFR